MPSAYLAGGDLATYGVPNATAAQIIQASAVIDAYLQRPEGVVWSPDAAGLPCYMAGLTPQMVYTAPGSIAPGLNVVVPVTGGMPNNDMIGDVVIVGRSHPTRTEACTISGVTPTSLTLSHVTYAHPAGDLLETGLVIAEERALPARRSVTRVASTPVVRLIAGCGRYAYGRRSQQASGAFQDLNLLAMVQTFGGPPLWIPFDVNNAGISAGTGDIWVPAGTLIATYSDVRLRYVAGYTAANLPSAIKQACASVVSTIAAFPELSGNTRRLQAGGTVVERFKDTALDADTRNLLEPFCAKLLF